MPRDARERAEWFAKRFGLSTARVYVAYVPASAVLARIVDGRQEAEVVVDPGGLRGVRPLVDAPRRRRGVVTPLT